MNGEQCQGMQRTYSWPSPTRLMTQGRKKIWDAEEDRILYGARTYNRKREIAYSNDRSRNATYEIARQIESIRKKTLDLHADTDNKGMGYSVTRYDEIPPHTGTEWTRVLWHLSTLKEAQTSQQLPLLRRKKKMILNAPSSYSQLTSRREDK